MSTQNTSTWTPGRVANTVGRIIILVVGVATCVAALGMGVGTPSQPGPGLWPLVAGVGFVGFMAYLIVTERDTEAEAFTSNSWKIPIAVVSLIVFTVMLAYLGLTVPVFVLLVVWLRVLGNEPVWLSVLLAACGSTALYLLFVVALSVPFPPDLILTLVAIEGA